MIHVVVIPLPVHGHTNPMLQLSLKLVCLGSINISFVTTRKSLKKFQQEFHHENLEFLTISDGEENSPGGGGEQGIWNNLLLLQRTSDSGEIEQLIQQSSQKHGPVSHFIFDLITVRCLINLWSKIEVPKSVFWTSSATFLLLSVHLRLLVAEGYVPLKTEHAKHAVLKDSVVPGITELNLHQDVPYSFQKPPDGDPTFRRMSCVREFALEASSVFINTFQELEDDAIRALLNVGVRVEAVGPLLPTGNNQEKEKGFTKVFSWLSERPVSSVIYVSFGTMASLSSRHQIEELAYGLENSGHFFLWVLAKESELLLPEDFVSRIAENQQGLICSWCPQLEVLQHSSVGGFLSHCGWNSVMESTYCGVGMIGWPCMAEQNLNIKYVEDVWGTGRRITSLDLDGGVMLKETIETAVQKLMGAEGGEVRERAARLSGAAKRAGWSINMQHFSNF